MGAVGIEPTSLDNEPSSLPLTYAPLICRMGLEPITLWSQTRYATIAPSTKKILCAQWDSNP
jgi:hypothetical protein